MIRKDEQWWRTHNHFMTWKHFPNHWLFVRGLHRSLVDSPHKESVMGTLMFSLMLSWTSCCTISQVTSHLRHHDFMWRNYNNGPHWWMNSPAKENMNLVTFMKNHQDRPGRNTFTLLKRICHYFDKIFITGGTGSCHFDNFQCNQWWKDHQNDNISHSVTKILNGIKYGTPGTSL